MVNTKKIMDACLDGINNPAFQPRDGKTFCNFFVCSVAISVGYKFLVGFTANQIIAHLDQSDFWTGIKMENASRHALTSFVIAGETAEKHGHVVVVIPGGKDAYSKKWNKLCPMVASIGSKVFIKGVNWAFKKEPRFWKKKRAMIS